MQKIYLIDSARFMASSLSNLINNISEGIHRTTCKFEHDDKKCETCRIKYKYWKCFFEKTNFKDDLIEYRCLCYSKNYQYKFAEKLKQRFITTATISLFYCCEKVFILMNI